MATKVKAVRIEEFERKLWVDRNAVVETSDGTKWVYSLEYNTDIWKDEDDYLDNAKSDFENEAESGIEDTELFYPYEEFLND